MTGTPKKQLQRSQLGSADKVVKSAKLPNLSIHLSPPVKASLKIASAILKRPQRTLVEDALCAYIATMPAEYREVIDYVAHRPPGSRVKE